MICLVCCHLALYLDFPWSRVLFLGIHCFDCANLRSIYISLNYERWHVCSIRCLDYCHLAFCLNFLWGRVLACLQWFSVWISTTMHSVWISSEDKCWHGCNNSVFGFLPPYALFRFPVSWVLACLERFGGRVFLLCQPTFYLDFPWGWVLESLQRFSGWIFWLIWWTSRGRRPGRFQIGFRFPNTLEGMGPLINYTWKVVLTTNIDKLSPQVVGGHLEL